MESIIINYLVMKNSRTNIVILISVFAFSLTGIAQEKKTEDKELTTFLIEREIPEAGKLSAEQLKGISQKSCSVLEEMGPEIQWVHSYVAENKVYCIYRAANEELIREHAEKGGFPVNMVTRLSTRIDPSTAQ